MDHPDGAGQYQAFEIWGKVGFQRNQLGFVQAPDFQFSIAGATDLKFVSSGHVVSLEKCLNGLTIAEDHFVSRHVGFDDKVRCKSHGKILPPAYAVAPADPSNRYKRLATSEIEMRIVNVALS